MHAELNQHERELLHAAVRCVAQFGGTFASAFWGVPTTVANQRLRRLERRKLLRGRKVLVSELSGTPKPLCSWKPGEKTPLIGRVSYLARRRWRDLALKVTRVYYATDLARAIFGRDPVKAPRDIQATHDLGLASVYLAFLRRYPLLTQQCWLNESEYAHNRGRFVKVEDAMLCRNGDVLLLIDFAGAYRPDRVQALLTHAEKHQVPIAIY